MHTAIEGPFCKVTSPVGVIFASLSAFEFVSESVDVALTNMPVDKPHFLLDEKSRLSPAPMVRWGIPQLPSFVTFRRSMRFPPNSNTRLAKS